MLSEFPLYLGLGHGRRWCLQMEARFSLTPPRLELKGAMTAPVVIMAVPKGCCQ